MKKELENVALAVNEYLKKDNKTARARYFGNSQRNTRKMLALDFLDEVKKQSIPEIANELKDLSAMLEETAKRNPSLKEKLNKYREVIYQEAPLIEKHHILNKDLLSDPLFVAKNLDNIFVYENADEKLKYHPQIILKFLKTHQEAREDIIITTTSLLNKKSIIKMLPEKIREMPSFQAHLLSNDYFCTTVSQKNILDINIAATAFRDAAANRAKEAMSFIIEASTPENAQIIFNYFPQEYQFFNNVIKAKPENVIKAVKANYNNILFVYDFEEDFTKINNNDLKILENATFKTFEEATAEKTKLGDNIPSKQKIDLETKIEKAAILSGKFYDFYSRKYEDLPEDIKNNLKFNINLIYNLDEKFIIHKDKVDDIFANIPKDIVKENDFQAALLKSESLGNKTNPDILNNFKFIKEQLSEGIFLGKYNSIENIFNNLRGNPTILKDFAKELLDVSHYRHLPLALRAEPTIISEAIDRTPFNIHQLPITKEIAYDVLIKARKAFFLTVADEIANESKENMFFAQEALKKLTTTLRLGNNPEKSFKDNLASAKEQAYLSYVEQEEKEIAKQRNLTSPKPGKM